MCYFPLSTDLHTEEAFCTILPQDCFLFPLLGQNKNVTLGIPEIGTFSAVTSAKIANYTKVFLPAG